MIARGIATGLTSALLACTGGAVLILQAANTAELSSAELNSWFFSVYVLGGILNFLLALKFKIPIAGAHSITAIAFVTTIASHFSFHQLIGGFILTGFLILMFGLSGWFSKVLDIIPKYLIDALMSGLLIRYVWGIIPGAIEFPLTAICAMIGYFVVSRFFRLSPTILAILFGILGISFEYSVPAITSSTFNLPQLYRPEFTFESFVSIAIPMSLLILSNDIAVAMASLRNNDFDTPVNKTLIISGFCTILTGLFGGHASNAGGMMTAICSGEEAGPKQTRYRAALFSSGFVICFGLFSWKLIDIIQVLPMPFVTMLVGFSLLGLFLSGLRSAFLNTREFIPALITFSISAAQVDFLYVSTPVWALVAGLLTRKCMILFEEKRKGRNEKINE